MSSCSHCRYFFHADCTCRRNPPTQTGEWGSASFPLIDDPEGTFCGMYDDDPLRFLEDGTGTRNRNKTGRTIKGKEGQK